MFGKLSHEQCVDITAKRRHHQLSLHPSSDVFDTSLRWRGRQSCQTTTSSTYVGFQFGSLGRSQSQTGCSLCNFPRVWASVFHSRSLMSPAFSILIEMENLQQITTRNTADFQQLSLHESARFWYLAFFDSWNSSVLSSQGTMNSTIITYFGYTDHINISGRRFERVTSIRKCYVRSQVYPLLQILGVTLYDIVCVQHAGGIF